MQILILNKVVLTEKRLAKSLSPGLYSSSGLLALTSLLVLLSEPYDVVASLDST